MATNRKSLSAEEKHEIVDIEESLLALLRSEQPADTLSNIKYTRFNYIKLSKDEKDSFYVIEKTPLGTCNNVFKGWLVSETDSKIVIGQGIVFKTFTEKDNIVKEDEEVKAIKKFFDPDAVLIKSGMSSAILMKFVNGEQVIADNGKVSPAIDKLPLTEKLSVIIQILQAVKKIHDEKWIHGDMKGQNMLLSQSGVKIIDFGLSLEEKEKSSGKLSPGKDTEETETETKIQEKEPRLLSLGSIGHIAPERLVGKPLTRAVDIYALPAIIGSIFGLDPLALKRRAREKEKAAPDLVDYIETTQPFDFKDINKIFEPSDFMSPLAKTTFATSMLEFLKKMESTNPRERPTAGEAVDFFVHFRSCLKLYEAFAKKDSHTFFTSHRDKSFFKENESLFEAIKPKGKK